MNEKTMSAYGAIIERGRVVSINSAAGTYIVESIDRTGVTTPAIPCITRKTDGDVVRLCRGDNVLEEWTRETDYTLPVVDDMVFFYLFQYGTGRVLCKM